MVCLSSLPLKRGRRGIAGVIFLVFISMVVPLIFLLGINTRIHPTRRWGELEPGPGFRNYNIAEGSEDFDPSEGDQSEHVDKLLRKFGPDLQKEVIGPNVNEVNKETIDSSPVTATGEPTRADHSSGSLPISPPVSEQKQLPDAKKEKVITIETTDYVKGANGDETQKSCQLEFGSYCTWREEHKEDMKDSMVKKLKDLLFVARAYYPTIAKLPAQEKLSREMKQNIQDFERIFSEASTDPDLPLHIERRQQKMEDVISKAKSFPVDCNNVDKKLRQILDLTEDEAHFHMKQSAFLYQLAVQTKPKSHHCLSMRLTVEYFRSHSVEFLPDDKNRDPAFYHYVIFSNNVLASSVVINSTLMHAKESEKQVFHLITDGQNYAAMKLWFFRSSYRNATIYVLNIEDVDLNHRDSFDTVHLSFSDEFRVSVRNTDKPLSIQMRTEYISVFGPAYFMLPDIFQRLEKVVVLDDDVVVQQDLSALWSLEMEGKVNGAVEYCGLRLGQLKSYLGDNTYDSNACAWMSGLNVIDLKKWRELNLTETYRRLRQALQRENEASSGVAALPATLLTFQNQIYTLDSSWVLSGLGHDYGINSQTIKEAAVLHYNGHMKPWLDLGISKYKGFWKKFLKRDDQFMDECNVNP